MVERRPLAFAGTELDTEMPRNATPEELAGLQAQVMVFAAEHDPLFPPDRVFPRAKMPLPSLVAAETLPAAITSSPPPVQQRSAHAFGRSSHRTDGSKERR